MKRAFWFKKKKWLHHITIHHHKFHILPSPSVSLPIIFSLIVWCKKKKKSQKSAENHSQSKTQRYSFYHHRESHYFWNFFNLKSLLVLYFIFFHFLPLCFDFQLTLRYLKPRVEMMPATNPISIAPNGPMLMSAHVPTATPPAKVAFWMCTCRNIKKNQAFNWVIF